MAVASNSFVYWCESIFGTEVNMSPSVHQDPDGLTSTWLTLHRQGQSSLWRTHTEIQIRFLMIRDCLEHGSETLGGTGQVVCFYGAT